MEKQKYSNNSTNVALNKIVCATPHRTSVKAYFESECYSSHRILQVVGLIQIEVIVLILRVLIDTLLGSTVNLLML